MTTKHTALAITALAVITTALVISWTLGRSYEHKIASDLVVKHLGAEYIDMTLPEEGKPSVQVNCITNKNVNTLFQYSGVDY